MPDLQEDNVLPNDSTFIGGVPQEPAEQSIDRKKERAKTLEALPVIREIIAHFEERITKRDSLGAIKVDISKDPALYQKIHEVNSMLIEALKEEKEMLEDLLDTHAKNM